MDHFQAWFRCFRGCEGKFPLTTVIYECPTCGGLLEVAHDIEALKTRSPQAWRELFEQRYMRTDWPYGSSVWGKKELVCPTVDDDNVVSMLKGAAIFFGQTGWARKSVLTICG